MRKYLSLIKFSHSVFAMPFALSGYFMAISKPEFSWSWKLFGLVVLSMIFARSAAMAFNRWLDKDIDKLNPRTQNREIPSGLVSSKNALYFTIVSVILFSATTWFINNLCFYLSPVALFVILGYSYTKRFTWLCHFILGLGLSLAPIGAFIAVTGYFDYAPILLSLMVLLWVSGFDIIYALQDQEFDAKHKLNSIPVLLGYHKSLNLAMIFHVFAVLIGIGIGWIQNYHWIYYSGLTLFTILVFIQHVVVRSKGKRFINWAFFNFNGYAAIIYGLAIGIEIFFEN